jgi:hypothetical protein
MMVKGHDRHGTIGLTCPRSVVCSDLQIVSHPHLWRRSLSVTDRSSVSIIVSAVDNVCPMAKVRKQDSGLQTDPEEYGMCVSIQRTLTNFVEDARLEDFRVKNTLIIANAFSIFPRSHYY